MFLFVNSGHFLHPDGFSCTGVSDGSKYFSLPDEYEDWVSHHPTIKFLGAGPCPMTKPEIEDWLVNMTSATYSDSLGIIFGTFEKLSWVQTISLARKYREDKSLSKPDLIIWGDVAFGGADLADFLGAPHMRFAPGHAFEPMDYPMTLYRPEYSYIPTFSTGFNPFGMSFLERVQNFLLSNIIQVADRITSTNWRNKLRAEIDLEPVSYLKPYNQYPLAVLVANFFGFAPARPLSPFVHFIGTVLPPSKITPLDRELEDWINSKDNVFVCLFNQLTLQIIVISMGTVSRFDKEQMLKLGRGLNDLEFSVVWLSPKVNHKNLPLSELKGHIKVVEWAPQFTLLGHPKVVAFMTVGGIGGVSEGIYNALPELCFPSHFEQRESCMLIEGRKLGLWIDKDNFTTKEVTEKFRELVYNPVYKKQAQFLSKTMKLAGGLPRTIEIIENSLDIGTSEHLVPYGPANMNWFTLNSWDVITFLGAIFYIVLRLLNAIYCCTCCKSSQKLKND